MKILMTFLLMAFSTVTFSSEAQKSADRFFENINKKNYEQTWDEASTYFQGQLNKAGWNSALVKVLNPLGKNTARKKKSETPIKSLPGAPDGEYVIFQFSSSFVNKKTATETLTLMKDSGEWKLAGYYIK